MDIFSLVQPRPDAEIQDLRSQFERAAPFPHVVIDGFLREAFFTQLQREFPQSGKEYDRFCREDGGQRGTNYANGSRKSFPSAFARLDELIASAAFRALVSRLTGIDHLEYDPDYFGGGIRESRSGTFLPPHLDFNHHPKTRFHRRMNLLFYLNDEWDAAWGGNLQVHRDPNEFRDNNSLVASYVPARNRCLIFETSETSWHGFDRLQLPTGMTRRAFTIYYYTEQRPGQERIQLHNTEYVEPPLPPHFQAGHVLTESDVALLHEYITRRDTRIRMLYDLRMQLEERMRNIAVFVVKTAAHRVMARVKRGLGKRP